ncbi:DUF6133 family protein [Leyella stercorea]
MPTLNQRIKDMFNYAGALVNLLLTI